MLTHLPYKILLNKLTLPFKCTQPICNITTDIHHRNSQNEAIQLPFKRYMKSFVNHKLSEAESVCRELTAVLPEIKDSNDFANLREFAYKNSITKMAAGLSYDRMSKKIRFQSGRDPWPRWAIRLDNLGRKVNQIPGGPSILLDETIAKKDKVRRRGE